MALLTEPQQDSLTELLNIAFGRTAAALSELTGHRVLIEAPQVKIHPLSELYPTLSSIIDENIATVHQIFSGPVGGDAFLVLDYEGAAQLVELLTMENYSPSVRMDASAREVLTEVGNILLNACLGMFGQLLQVHISFAVPRLRLEDLQTLLTSLVIGKDELQYALVAYTNFQVQTSQMNGYLVLALGVVSLEHLLQAVETWEQTLTGG